MQTFDVFLTPDAIKDLKEIYEYIAQESGLPEVAWAYMEKLHLKCMDLSMAPLRGRKRDDVRQHLRVLALDKHAVAAFEVDTKKHMVIILNIFYGGRNYETLLGHDAS